MTPLQKITALLFLLFAAAGAFACDPAQGSGQCGFIGANGWVATKEEQTASYLQPSYDAPSNYEYAPSYDYVPSYTPPPPVRESRYGAFAVYPNLSGLWDSHKMFASVHGLHSKESARKRALQECKRKSGHICQVFDYADQCFSVTMGEDSEGLKIFSAVSPQPGQAPLDAMQQCIAAQGKDCEFVVQEECSLPQ
jgi:hypothetical protein